ncbi:DedA family protein [Saxibacter everestensis]|uniref:DedA family protein n=1 Tax=Saxibacter everestensis TaxID=2909229 RepID=A0ABY8QWX9_9MICO|nr:DedA family protein [Brevibacteriaceae bacterium ZFBP1038]
MNLDAVIETLASGPWALPVMFICTVIDGFFPPVPSESLVIGMSTVALGVDPWRLIPIALLGWAAAVAGDNLAYLIGRRCKFHRLRLFAGPRAQRAVATAEKALLRRGTSVILTARFIPIGRVAVNMAAGSLGYQRRRFFIATVISGGLWTAQALFFALVGHVWFGAHSTVAAVVVGIVLAVTVGLIIDAVAQRRSAIDRRAAAVEQSKSAERHDFTPTQ